MRVSGPTGQETEALEVGGMYLIDDRVVPAYQFFREFAPQPERRFAQRRQAERRADEDRRQRRRRTRRATAQRQRARRRSDALTVGERQALAEGRMPV